MNARRRTVLAALVVLAAALPAAAQFAATEVSEPGSPNPFVVTKTLWSWEDIPGVTYSVYRSPAPDGGFECILDLHPASTWPGDPTLPGAGNVLHYLVTAFDGAEDNSPGTWSDGTPRVLAVPCPRVVACCAIDGTCTDLEFEDCEAQGGSSQAIGSECLTTTCPAPEACCHPDGDCDDLLPSDCAFGGSTPQGPGTSCLTSTCLPFQACCLTDGSCADLAPADCVTQGGTSQGPGTTCLTTTCVVTVACCLPDGSCADLDRGVCAGQEGAPQPAGSTCPSPNCVPFEACCSGVTCEDLLPAFCISLGATPQGPGTTCRSVTCVADEACCFADGSCSELAPADCATQGGTAQGAGTTCTSVTCVANEACCMTDGSCVELAPADCVTQGGTAQGPGTTCTSVTCVANEACCFANGSCADRTPADCTAQGGTPQGPGTTCLVSTCIPTQACCLTDGSCADLAPLDCVTQGGAPKGPGTTCLTSTCVADEACCLPDGSCADIAPADCTTQEGTPQGPGSACSSATCEPYQACCTGTGACSDVQPADCLAAGSTPLGPCTQCTSSICPSPCPSGAPVSGRPTLRRVSIGNFDRPMFLTSPPGDFDRVFVLERPGRIQVVHRSGARSQFLDFSARVPSLSSEKGALGLAFHPDYACNGKFYVHYSGAASAGCGPDNCATLAEYTVSANPDVANAASFRVVLTQADFAANHNGGWIAFGPDGYLYQAFGDGGGGGDPNETGQNRGIWLGKMLRIDVDGRDPGLQYAVPPSNPFVGVAGTRPEIWSLGLRNPWRNSFDRGTGDLYIADVGQGAWEEVDVSPASAGGGSGLNYGWDDMEGMVCFEPAVGCLTAGRTLPDHVYSHGDGCSITGGYVYRGCRMPGWNGVYFFAEYCNGWMDAFEYVGGAVTNYQRVYAPGTLANPVSFGEDAAGEIYVIERDGPIYRLEP